MLKKVLWFSLNFAHLWLKIIKCVPISDFVTSLQVEKKWNLRFGIWVICCSNSYGWLGFFLNFALLRRAVPYSGVLTTTTPSPLGSTVSRRMEHPPRWSTSKLFYFFRFLISVMEQFTWSTSQLVQFKYILKMFFRVKVNYVYDRKTSLKEKEDIAIKKYLTNSTKLLHDRYDRT